MKREIWEAWGPSIVLQTSPRARVWTQGLRLAKLALSLSYASHQSMGIPSVLKSHQASLAQMPAQFSEMQISFASLMQYINCCRFSVLLCTISMPAWVQSTLIDQCLAETGPVPSQIEKPGQQLDHFPLQIPQGQPVSQTFSLYLIPKHCSGMAFPVAEERLGLKMSNGNRTPLWPLLTTSTQEEPEGRDTI